MSWLRFKDISQYQGAWTDTGEDGVMIKIGGGDAGLYFDSRAGGDYAGAQSAGKLIGGYWFAGGSNAGAEAAFFLKGMQPYSDGDVFALDIERGSTWDPAGDSNAVQWVSDFVNYVHDQTGCWPFVYMNLATLNAHDWSPVLANCPLWLADWAVSPDANIPTSHMYVMQQYGDGPGYDHDAWFGTRDAFLACGWHQPASAPTPVDVPATPAPVPTPVVDTTTPTPTVVTPATPVPTTVTPPVVGPEPTPDTAEAATTARGLAALWHWLQNGIMNLLHKK